MTVTTNPAPSGMSATEKREVRSAVRAHFEILRSEIVAKESEFRAQAKKMAAERYADELKAFDKGKKKVAEIRKRAEASAERIAEELRTLYPGWTIKIEPWRDMNLNVSHTNRQQFEDLAYAEITARAAEARHKLKVQENAIMKELLQDGRSDEAKAYVSGLPSLQEVLSLPSLDEVQRRALEQG